MKVWPLWCGHLSFFYKSRRLICSVMCKRSPHVLTMAHDGRLNFPRCISRCRLENAFLNSMWIKSYWIFNQNLNRYAYDNLPCLNQLLTTAEDGWEGYTFTPKFCFFLDSLLHTESWTLYYDLICIQCDSLPRSSTPFLFSVNFSRATTSLLPGRAPSFASFFVIMLLSFFCKLIGSTCTSYTYERLPTEIPLCRYTSGTFHLSGYTM